MKRTIKIICDELTCLLMGWIPLLTLKCVFALTLKYCVEKQVNHIHKQSIKQTKSKTKNRPNIILRNLLMLQAMYLFFSIDYLHNQLCPHEQ